MCSRCGRICASLSRSQADGKDILCVLAGRGCIHHLHRFTPLNNDEVVALESGGQQGRAEKGVNVISLACGVALCPSIPSPPVRLWMCTLVGKTHTRRCCFALATLQSHPKIPRNDRPCSPVKYHAHHPQPQGHTSRVASKIWCHIR